MRDEEEGEECLENEMTEGCNKRRSKGGKEVQQQEGEEVMTSLLRRGNTGPGTRVKRLNMQ